MLIYFAAFAGAVQMIAPDHWLPLSVFSWQRGWRVSSTVLFSLFFFVLHVALGLGLYLAFAHPLSLVTENHLAIFTVCFLGVLGLLRAFHFSKLGYIIHRAPRWNNKSLGGAKSLLLFLGPSEMLIPVLMKARMDQVGFRIPVVAFFLGTVLAGSLLVASSRLLWNRPTMLPKAVHWAHGKLAAYPAALGALMGGLLLMHFMNH
jgi:hypothetical protein